MFQIFIFILIISSIILVGMEIIPLITEKFKQFQFKKVNKAEAQLNNMYISVKRKRLLLFYTLSPLALGLAVFFLFNNLILAVLISLGGLIVPDIVIKKLAALRRGRFQNQLIDTLMLISSSIKAGLSLLQAIEVVAEETPAPISDEFGLILREHRMGITLEESLSHLTQRMPLNELRLIVNAILVAKETGGDLTKVISRLCTTIRDNRKLKDTMLTLTLQGKLQGMIMSCLPFLFAAWVISFNREHFSIMFNSETGRTLLIAAIVLQAVGLILIRRFSTIKI